MRPITKQLCDNVLKHVEIMDNLVFELLIQIAYQGKLFFYAVN